MKVMRRLGNIFDRAMGVMALLAGILLISEMLLINLAVAQRYFFHRPIGWAIEVSQYMMVFMGFLVFGWVLRREGHVKMDIFLTSFNRRTQALINTITSAINTVVAFILTFFTAKVTWDLYQIDYFTPTILMIPKSIFLSVIAFGCFMLSIQFVRRTLGFLEIWRSPHKNED